ncbi:ABC transporter permease subunit, partial [Escherichia coli]|uniref:ABC transporter permease subunit n=1 Tax=Escherichia coli TaxID=562 RepID=UPI00215653E8
FIQGVLATFSEADALTRSQREQSIALLAKTMGLPRAAQSLGASRAQVLWFVILPGALPEILTGLRIGLGVGWSTLVAAELIAATRGLGFMVQSAGEFLATDVVLAGIAVIAIIAFLLELGLRALQRRLTPWHGEVQ